MLITAAPQRVIRWLALIALVVATIAIGQASPASAADLCDPPFDSNGERIINCEETKEPGAEDDPGPGDNPGTPPPPPCDLSGDFEFCEGENACWIDVSAIQELETLETLYFPHDGVRGEGIIHPGPRPDEDDILMYKYCEEPDGTPQEEYYWNTPGDPPPISLAEQARQAWGELEVPNFTLKFSPATGTSPTLTTFVGPATSFWVDGPGDGQIVGDPAITLVGVATPRHVSIDPGDGTTPFTCPPWPVAANDNCDYTYDTPSVGGASDVNGQPAYVAEAILVYDVHFEFIGGSAPVDIPGLEPQYTVLQSTDTTPVAVEEIQALVTLLN